MKTLPPNVKIKPITNGGSRYLIKLLGDNNENFSIYAGNSPTKAATISSETLNSICAIESRRKRSLKIFLRGKEIIHPEAIAKMYEAKMTVTEYMVVSKIKINILVIAT